MTVFELALRGYGSVEEIEGWDTPRFLDAVEHASIKHDIEAFHAQNPEG